MKAPPLTLEQIVTSPQGFGVTSASPLQRAICRALDGLPLGALAEREDVRRAFGGEAAVAALPVGEPPKEAILLAAIRTLKSILAAASAICASQRIDVSGLVHGEVPRFSCLSYDVDKGRVVLDLLVGAIQASPVLRALLVEEPTADSVLLWHPSRRPVEIKVVAMAKAGGSTLARWSAGMSVDEAPRTIGAEDGVKNFTEARRYVLGRLLPGAQLLSIGSPWAPFGPIYDMVQASFGKPSRHLVVIRGRGPDMNPQYFTPEFCADLLAQDAGAYRSDVEGEFLDPEASLFEDSALRRCTRAAPAELRRIEGAAYAAAMDPASRMNSWTLAIATRIDHRIVVACARQWMPRKGQPLSPGEVLDEIARLCKSYGIRTVHSDGWSGDAIRDLARARGIEVIARTRSTQERTELYENLRTLVQQDAIELPPVPEVRSDLLSVRKRITQRSSTIELPTSGDGRHADFAPAIALVASLAVDAIDEDSIEIAAPPLTRDFETESIGFTFDEAETANLPWWKKEPSRF